MKLSAALNGCQRVSWGRNPRSTVLGVLVALTTAFSAFAEIPVYNRASWGRWAPTDKTGQEECRWNRRHLLLRAAAMEANPATLTTREEAGKFCRVLTLTIVDPYTRERHTGPASEIDVDHVVPLAEAHRSGGWRWSAERRRAFANDPLNLIPVHESVNASKGDVDLAGESERGRRDAGWWPPDPDQHCWYAGTWLAVKTKWDLSFDALEVAALLEVIRGCWREPEPATPGCRQAVAGLAVLDSEPGFDPAELSALINLLTECAGNNVP